MALLAASLVVLAAGAWPARARDLDEEDVRPDTSLYVPTPEEYMRSLRRSGMQAVLDQRAAAKPGARPSSVTSTSSWSSVGPVGDPNPSPDFGTPGSENNGRIRSFQIRAGTSGWEVYAGASGGGLWRAYSATGPVWASLGDNLPNPSVGAFAVSPLDDQDILVGTGDYARRLDGAGLFHSTDRGLSWSPVTLPVSPTCFFRILYNPAPTVVLAASSAGLLRSESGPGGPYAVVLSGMVTDLVQHPSSPSILFCCRSSFGAPDSGGVYRSMDGGKTWLFQASTNAPRDSIENAALAICRNQPQTLLYVYEYSLKFGENYAAVINGMRISNDGGASWTPIMTDSIGGQADHALSVAIDPVDPRHLFVGCNQLFESKLGGSPHSWIDITGIAAHQDQTQLYFSPLTGDNTLWVCNDGGIHAINTRTYTGTSWNGNNSTGLRVSTIDYMDAKRNLITIGRQDDGSVTSDDDGLTWRVHICCDGSGTAISDEFNEIYWYDMNQSVYLAPFCCSTSNVTNDVLVTKLLYDRFSDQVFSLFDDQSHTRVLHRAASGVGTWTQDNFDVPSGLTGLADRQIDGQSMYAFGGRWIYELEPSGGVWQAGTGLQLPNNVTCVYASREQPLEAWATMSGGSERVAHTTDGWHTWTDISGSDPNDPMRQVISATTIVAVPFQRNELYVGTPIGVFRSLDGGAHWAPFQDGLPIVRVSAMRYVSDWTHNGNDKLVISTYGRGVYERIIPETPLVYADPRTNEFATQDGSFEHGYTYFGWALPATPTGGRLALFGNGNTYQVPSYWSTPLILDAWGGPATLVPGAVGAPHAVTGPAGPRGVATRAREAGR